MKKKFNFRLLLQILFFALITLISINHTLIQKGIEIPLISSASLHALCPYGGVETFISLITAGTLVRKIHLSAVVLLVIILAISTLFGPVFCSYVCPLGSIQEWFSKLGKKIFPKKHNKFVPKKLDKVLRYVRYGVLIWTVYLTTKSLKLVFEAFDPYYALFHFWTGEVAVTSLVILAMTIILSFFIERAWCKYACPFGALIGLTNLFRVFKIRRNEDTCISCNLCSKKCPMNIDVAKKQIVNDHQCISCGICTSDQVCPVESTVTHSASKKSKKGITTRIIAISIVVILAAGILIGKATDTFITQSRKIPNKIQSGLFKGMADPYDIRGSYSFRDITNSFDITVETLAKAFNIDPAIAPDYQLKNFESAGMGVGTSSVRQFVALYTGLPYSGESDGLPFSALDLLLNEGKITSAQYDSFLNSYNTHDNSYTDSTENTDQNKIDTPDEYSDQDEEHTTINGSSTVKDAIALGLSVETLEEILETELSDSNALIKDVAKAGGLRFSEVKNTLNSLLN